MTISVLATEEKRIVPTAPSARSAGTETFSIASALMTRALGLVFFIAFVSFSTQASGLIGSDGIVPIQSTLDGYYKSFGPNACLMRPTLFWLNSSDWALGIVLSAGAISSIMLTAAWFAPVSLGLCWIAFLSLVNGAPTFTGFQWDKLLLESSLLAIFLIGLRKNGEYRAAPLWLMRFLLFRVLFLSGLAKILNDGDKWTSLSALDHYFETQLLPNAAAWYLHNLPQWCHAAGAGLTLIYELVLPLLLFAPRRMRMIAGLVCVLGQFAMLMSGNHGYINILVAVLCLSLYDDKFFEKSFKWKGNGLAPPIVARSGKLVIAAVVVVSLAIAYQALIGRLPNAIRTPLFAVNNGYHFVNSYGLYPRVILQRTEIVIEGSNDLVTWKPYKFKSHIGDPSIAPPTVAPTQPRLDWMMRFAALGPVDNNRWFQHFVLKLLQGSKPVIGLIDAQPFTDGPPKYIRADVYEYSFTTPEQRSTTGNWWNRKLLARYIDPVDAQMQMLPPTVSNDAHEKLIWWDSRRHWRFAGSWYPEHGWQLHQSIAELMSQAAAQNSSPERISAAVIPHAALRFSGLEAARAYVSLKAQDTPKRIILIGPYHQRNKATKKSNAFLTSSIALCTPLGDVPVDEEACKKLSAETGFSFDDAVHAREHSLEMQLPFIRFNFANIPVVPILIGEVEEQSTIRSIANSIRQIMRDGDVIIVSADMTHYGGGFGFTPPTGKPEELVHNLDDQAYKLIADRDIAGFLSWARNNNNYVCGLESIAVLMALAPHEDQAHRLGYKTFSDNALYVGYMPMIFSKSAK